MSNVYFFGSLAYHDETILRPIFNELRLNGMNVSHHATDPDGGLVHIPGHESAVVYSWQAMVRDFQALPIKSDDCIFISDFWNPAVFEIKFLLARTGRKNTRIFTIHHGSSHLPGDFAAASEFAPWVSRAEEAWVSCYDTIFCGSDKITKIMKAKCPSGNFVTSYLPITSLLSTVRSVEHSKLKRIENTAIMPLRMDPDKGVDDFIRFVDNNPDFTFYAFAAEDKWKRPNLVIEPQSTREILFRREQQCEFVVSFAKQETFGYGVVEAVLNGCIPVLQGSETNCYQELFPRNTLESSLVDKKLQFYRMMTVPNIHWLAGYAEKVIAASMR